MYKLNAGDKVAAVSPSWGGAGEFPQRFAAGKHELESRFGVELVTMPNTLASAEFLASNPQARAEDLQQAFADPDIKAVFACIGGDDAIRLHPYLDKALLRANPKPFMGYSDTTALHLLFSSLGIPCFYGPAIMAGFAEAGGMFAYTERAVRRCLFDWDGRGDIPPDKGGWTNAVPEFGLPDAPPRPRLPAESRVALQGQQVARGRLLGGCFEVLEFCRGTPVWPGMNAWQDALLFFEIADGAKYTHPDRLTWFVRSLAVSNELEQVKGVLMGRTGETLPVSAYAAYEQALVSALRECGKGDIPVIGRMEFGHTDPMCVLPYGALAEIDPSNCRVTLLEDPLAQDPSG